MQTAFALSVPGVPFPVRLLHVPGSAVLVAHGHGIRQAPAHKDKQDDRRQHGDGRPGQDRLVIGSVNGRQHRDPDLHDKVIFNIFMPALLFKNIYERDLNFNACDC